MRFKNVRARFAYVRTRRLEQDAPMYPHGNLASSASVYTHCKNLLGRP